MTDLVIISASYKRPLVTKLFALGIERLRKEYGYFPVVVSGDDISPFEGHQIDFLYKDNHPVSDKFNSSLLASMDYSPRYIMVLGSDDLIPSDVFGEYLNNLDVDYLGVKSVLYYSLEGASKGMARMQNTSIIIGAGRTFSVELLKKSKNYLNLWDKPKDRALDNLMYSKLRHNISSSKEISGHIIDIKTKVNINAFNRWNIEGFFPEKDIWDMLSEEEVELIKQIKTT